MIRRVAPFLFSAAMLACLTPASAQQDPGARAGNSIVPSTHSAGCGGVLCDGNDPRRAAGAPPPPPCEGLLCSMSPYAMARPVTASEAARLQEERTRAEAAAAAAPPAKPEKRSTRRSAKAKAGTAIARRTPDPASAPQPAPAPQ